MQRFLRAAGRDAKDNANSRAGPQGYGARKRLRKTTHETWSKEVRTLDLRCYAIAFCIATIVTGCDGPQASIAVPGAQRLLQTPVVNGQSLLWVSESSKIDVLTYPQGALIGRYLNVTPAGECADSAGDVLITNWGNADILIFNRGNLGPPFTVNDPGFYVGDCGIDPATGDLAVTNALTSGSKAGSVGVYTNLQGSPKLFTIKNFYTYYFCSYDNSGNLFVVGTDNSSPTTHVEFAELPKGGSRFSLLKVNKTLTSPGGVLWDGSHIVLADPNASVIYQLQISGSQAKVVGTTKFAAPRPVGQFWIVPPKGKQSAILIARPVGGGTYESVSYWKYPAGGKPIKTISGFQGVGGVTVSIAPY
jgi:hypothetical protein